MERVNIGILGLGNISGIYLQNLTQVFKEVRIAGVYDLLPEKVAEACEKYEIPNKGYQSMEELLADPEIELVLNLTRPFEHYDVSKAALLAGKHVYSEKPLAATYEEGKELVELAEEKGLYLGGAPDTYLGAGIQTCRRLIDAGFIGRPIAAHAHMKCHGHETWHPSPEFYYQNGGGPMMDMGPYYVTALVNLLGRVKGLTGSASKGFETRTITSQPKAGKVVPVEAYTHLNGIMDFENGAVGTITTSFDVYCDNGCVLEIYGTEGTIKVPDPNGFDGPVYLYRKEDKEFKQVPLMFDYPENSRGLGLADMAKAIRTGRRARANCEQTLHVLEIMTSVEKSGEEKKYITLESPYEREPAMKQNLIKGILD